MKGRALLTLVLMAFLLQTAATPLVAVHACQAMNMASQFDTSEELSATHAGHNENMADQGAMLADNGEQSCQCVDCACPQTQCHAHAFLMISTHQKELTAEPDKRFKIHHYPFLSHPITPNIRPPIIA